MDSLFTSRLAKEEASKKKKKRRADSGGGSQQNSSFFQGESTSTTDWYFGNLSAVSTGQGEFKRVWGNIVLEDNWRRSAKSASMGPGAVVAKVEETEKVVQPAEEVTPEKAKNAAFKELYAKLPKTMEEKKEALSKIEEAYFKLGDLYYFQLEEKDNAERTYQQLLTRFSASEHKPEVLYKMYLINKENGGTLADVFAEQLKTEFPNSTYTKILLNPDYLKETNVAQEKQKIIYREAYAEYQHNNLRATQEKLKQAHGIGETQFTPQLDLLQILITGKTEDVTRYQYELGEFIKKYPDKKLNGYAEQLLASSKTFLEKSERAKGIRFVSSFDEPHYFVIVHRIQDQASTQISQQLDQMNLKLFKSFKLAATNLIFNDQYAMTFVGDLPGQTEALEYLRQFDSKLAVGKPFANLNFHNFVITKDNFNIFYRNKALDEYLSFFDRYYKK